VVLVQDGCVDVEPGDGVREERTGVTGESVVVRKALDEDEVRRGVLGDPLPFVLLDLRQRIRHLDCVVQVVTQLGEAFSNGIRNVAIVFMHAYTFPDHERAVARIAKDIGFTQVSLSSEVMPMVKIVPRGFTATADAYLTPQITRYIAGFRAGFDENFESVKVTVPAIWLGVFHLTLASRCGRWCVVAWLWSISCRSCNRTVD
jgi:hypothetical protein